MTSTLPMIGFIACLFVITIKRDATILISILMMAMLHPMFTLTIGVSTKTMGQFLSRKCSGFLQHKILTRLFTYSINCHFTMIAGLTMYMYKMWRDLGKRAEFAFSDKSYTNIKDAMNIIDEILNGLNTAFVLYTNFLEQCHFPKGTNSPILEQSDLQFWQSKRTNQHLFHKIPFVVAYNF